MALQEGHELLVGHVGDGRGRRAGGAGDVTPEVLERLRAKGAKRGEKKCGSRWGRLRFGGEADIELKVGMFASSNREDVMYTPDIMLVHMVGGN